MNSQNIADILKIINAILPLLISLGADLYQPIVNIINAALESGDPTEEQKTALLELRQKADQAFEDAVAAREAAVNTTTEPQAPEGGDS